MAAARAAFSVDEPISAVVANGLAQDIYVEDLRTGCSIGILERETNAAKNLWQALPDCGSERLAAVLAIGPGHGRTVRIDPQSLAAAGEPLLPGTYRLAVPWRRAPHLGGGPAVSRSAPFVVR